MADDISLLYPNTFNIARIISSPLILDKDRIQPLFHGNGNIVLKKDRLNCVGHGSLQPTRTCAEWMRTLSA